MRKTSILTFSIPPVSRLWLMSSGCGRTEKKWLKGKCVSIPPGSLRCFRLQFLDHLRICRNHLVAPRSVVVHCPMRVIFEFSPAISTFKESSPPNEPRFQIPEIWWFNKDRTDSIDVWNAIYMCWLIFGQKLIRLIGLCDDYNLSESFGYEDGSFRK